jgi:hypothetical protein
MSSTRRVLRGSLAGEARLRVVLSRVLWEASEVNPCCRFEIFNNINRPLAFIPKLSGNYLRFSVFICLTSAVSVSKKDFYKRSNLLNREDAKDAKEDKEGKEKKKTQFAYIIKLRFFFNLDSRIT